MPMFSRPRTRRSAVLVPALALALSAVRAPQKRLITEQDTLKFVWIADLYPGAGG